MPNEVTVRFSGQLGPIEDYEKEIRLECSDTRSDSEVRLECDMISISYIAIYTYAQS